LFQAFAPGRAAEEKEDAETSEAKEERQPVWWAVFTFIVAVF